MVAVARITVASHVVMNFKAHLVADWTLKIRPMSLVPTDGGKTVDGIMRYIYGG